MELADGLALAVIFLVVTNMIQATLILKFSDLVNDIKELVGLPGGGGHKVAFIEIHVQENTMASVIEGGSVTFVVQGFNKKGNPVPLTDAAVTTGDAAVATASVNADGTGGVLSGVAAGSTSLDAGAAGKTASEPVTVTADTAVDSVKIVFGEP